MSRVGDLGGTADEAESAVVARDLRFPPDGATLGVAQIVEQVEAVAGELDRGVRLVAVSMSRQVRSSDTESAMLVTMSPEVAPSGDVVCARPGPLGEPGEMVDAGEDGDGVLAVLRVLVDPVLDHAGEPAVVDAVPGGDVADGDLR